MTMIPMTCDECSEPYDVEVTLVSPPVKGRTWGAWEDCYPAEDAEWDVTGPSECPVCQADLDTLANWDYAIEQVEKGWDDL
jgi:hypothetical protein